MKRRILLFLGALILGAVLWAVFSGPKHRFTLADGAVVTFHGGSAGVSNRHCFGNVAKRVAAKLPWTWAQKIAASSVLAMPVDGRTNLVLWVTYRGTAPNPREPYRFRCIHDAGTNELFFSSYTQELPSGEAATAFYLARWPLRSQWLTFQALATNATPGAKPLWEARVSNPLRLDYPQWEPDVLPASRTVDNVTVSLEQIVPTTPPFTHWIQDVAPVQAQLRVTSRDQPEASWAICSASFHDPLGKRSGSSSRFEARNNGAIHDLDFFPWLFAGDRAGKLGVAFAQMEPFATNSIVALSELDLPAGGQHINQMLRTNSPFGEIPMSVSVSRSGTQTGFDVFVNNWQHQEGDFPTPGRYWFEPFAATDDRGRSYSFLPPQKVAGGPMVIHRTLVAPDAKRLILKVAATRMIYVEFTVGPESVTKAKVQ